VVAGTDDQSAGLGAALRGQLLRRSLHDFVRWSFGILYPGKEFVDGEHIRTICAHLQYLTEHRAEWRGLIVNIPPRHIKSTIISVCWPVWLWIRDPGEQILSASYSMALAKRDAVRSRRIIESPQFHKLFGSMHLDGDAESLVEIRDDQNEKMRYENRAGGFRIATSVGGTTTGEGGTVRILDDPQKAEEATSDLKRQSTLDWIAETWTSRVAGHNPIEVLVMQRLHDKDATAYYLKERTGFQHLCLPAICEPDRRCRTALPVGGGKTYTDDREAGAALWPEMYPADRLKEISANEYVWNGQYRQSPSSKGGTIVKEKWLRPWTVLPVADEKHPDKPHGFSFIFSSWDCKNKKTISGAFVAGQLWAVRWPRVYLLDQKRERWGFTETLDAIREANKEWSALGFDCYAHLIEDKANGPSVIEVLSDEIPGILPVPVDGGDKLQRLLAETPMMRSGCVYIPDKDQVPWVREYLAEMLTFPSSAEKDQVDATSQALAYVRKSFGVSIHSDAEGDAEEPAPAGTTIPTPAQDRNTTPPDDADDDFDSLYQ
jgi:predicted phage terminase large subunit-like protein